MINYMNDTTFIIIILGAMVVTYIPRMLPLVLLSKSKLPKKVEEFLDYIPIAILGSILFSTLIYRNDSIDLSIDNEYLIAGILTVIVAKFVKRVDVIVIFGIIITIVLRFIF
jgi:branched-subunit amino acid transport protein